jgi:hypothetical protein
VPRSNISSRFILFFIFFLHDFDTIFGDLRVFLILPILYGFFSLLFETLAKQYRHELRKIFIWFGSFVAGQSAAAATGR